MRHVQESEPLKWGFAFCTLANWNNTICGDGSHTSLAANGALTGLLLFFFFFIIFFCEREQIRGVALIFHSRFQITHWSSGDETGSSGVISSTLRPLPPVVMGIFSMMFRAWRETEAREHAEDPMSTHTHAHTHTRARARTHTHTHTHTKHTGAWVKKEKEKKKQTKVNVRN